MKINDPAHEYTLGCGQTVKFIKRVDGKLIHNGTTNEELLQVLIDRTKGLNDKFPCHENDMAIIHMEIALEHFLDRTTKRIAQGVESQDKPHVS